MQERMSTPQAKYRERHKNDRCHVCGILYAGPYSKCNGCRDKEKARYQAKKTANICPKCKGPSTIGIICDICKYTDKILRLMSLGRGTPEHKEADLARIKERGRTLRFQILKGYGEKCICCSETEPIFLDLDHVHNNGAEERKTTRKGYVLYAWVIQNNFPSDYQLLCKNCNWGKYINKGVCPHQSTTT